MTTRPSIPTRIRNLLRMMRAQFLIGILFPIIAGTSLAVYGTHAFHLISFLLTIGIGLGLHIATNVYNDVYDTLQHADSSNVDERGVFSGGSGLILSDPKLLKIMIRLARSGLVLSLICCIGLLTFLDSSLWLPLILILGISAFLSKYYTAAPIKLGYRGFGEIAVWLGFGPFAVILGILSQNTTPTLWMVPFMPLIGLTTLLIQWFGQLMDITADEQAGKRGLVIRMGAANARYGYLTLHILILINLLILTWSYPHLWWTLLIIIVLYLIVFPRLWTTVKHHYTESKTLRSVSIMNAALYFITSLVYVIGLISLLIKI